MTNMIRIRRSNVTGSIPPTTVPSQYGEILANLTDHKIYVRGGAGGAVLVADRTEDHSETRIYAKGDLVVYQFNIWQAKAVVAAGPFVVSQWNEIGAAGTAILKVPTGNTTNHIDTTTIPAATGLLITAPDTQTGDMLRLKNDNVNDGRYAAIDAFGFPNARFGPSIQRITQASHGFSFPGQCLSRTGAGWILSDSIHIPLGVVEQVIDANTFVIRYGGPIANLNVGAFATGVIAANTKYYLSATVPGQLTTVAPAVSPVLVLVTTTVTAGVVTLIQAAAAALPLSGGTMLGDITFASTRGIVFTTPDTAIRQRGAAGPEIDMFVTNALAARVDAHGPIATTAQSIMTREKGDARYSQDVSSGPLVITPGGTVSFTHGLNFEPTWAKIILYCLVAEAGFAVNDTLFVSENCSDATTTRLNSIWYANVNTVNLRFTNAANCFATGHRNTGVPTALTNANWRVYLTVGT